MDNSIPYTCGYSVTIPNSPPPSYSNGIMNHSRCDSIGYRAVNYNSITNQLICQQDVTYPTELTGSGGIDDCVSCPSYVITSSTTRALYPNGVPVTIPCGSRSTVVVEIEIVDMDALDIILAGNCSF